MLSTVTFLSIIFKEDHPFFFVLSYISIAQMGRIKAENMQISILKFFHCVFNAFNQCFIVNCRILYKQTTYWVCSPEFYVAYIRKTK